MNKEEFAIEEKTYENPEGLKIKIIFSNLDPETEELMNQEWFDIDEIWQVCLVQEMEFSQSTCIRIVIGLNSHLFERE